MPPRPLQSALPTRLRPADLLHTCDAFADGVLEGGDQAAFPLGWVHDVGAAGDTPFETLSVHAYSPPLTAMSYYEVTARQRLRRTRTELTDQPEKTA